MNKLTNFECYVIEEKGTEPAFSGTYYQHNAKGLYLCKKCHSPLYRSSDKFNAHCGWPAFDDEIQGAVTRNIDVDGSRTEIVCSQCGGHLGHVFEGEYLTPKNIRHCVNSISLLFQPQDDSQIVTSYAFATFGAGCFWCVEAIFKSLKGVINVTSGYSGGGADDANYKSVCSGLTEHAEVVHIEFDTQLIDFITLLQVFFESHDPTSLNRQGNDKGPQYRSVIFSHSVEQVEQANEMINQLTVAKVFDAPIVTQVSAFEAFYPAENYHNDYFALHGQQPYCEMVLRPKVEKMKILFAHLQREYITNG